MAVRKIDYAKFNAALDRLMSTESGDFDERAVSAAAVDDESVTADIISPRAADASGSISVQVTMANGAVPISGAKVTISDANGNVTESGITDQSGKIKWIKLPAPSLEYSQEPGLTVPYYTYNIRIEKPGFYTEEFLNVAVFPGIESIQGASLEPLDADALEGDRVITVTESGPQISGSDTSEITNRT